MKTPTNNPEAMDEILLSEILYETEIDLLHGRKSVAEGFEYAYDDATIALLKKNFRREGSLYLLAREAGTFAGFVSADTDWWEDGHYFLREIFVDPARQGRGLGKRLMTACIQHARSRGAIAIVTETAYENAPMRRLAESCGFGIWDNPQWQEGITYKLALR